MICFFFTFFRFLLPAYGSWRPARPLDRPRDCAQEAEALLQVPDPRAGEGVPVQRVREQAEAMGASEEPQPHREANQNMVPEQES